MSQAKSSFWKQLSYFGNGEKLNEQFERSPRDRQSEQYYRSRWQHDKVIRTTHGVNCTGSCSWKVHVKDGIIAWETQHTDYPSTGPDMPEYEPRGCQRGASFSWYIYSPNRVRYPYIRSKLMKLWSEALQQYQDPVQAWKSIVENPEKEKLYKKARGKGGFVRTSWHEINSLISAAMIYTLQKEGPDRIFGFSPIPAMSMVSYAAGSRFLNLVGGSMLSFYDWYADLPPASPQVWGEQTDVPVSSDWYNSSYLLVWGSNVPQTRTPDSHFLVEARYKGAKVVAVTPDYAVLTKFADTWLPVEAGMDAALGMAMTHVILKEYYVDQQTPYFLNYVKKYTDLPFVITLTEKNGIYRAGKFLRAEQLNMAIENAAWKPVLFDQTKQTFAVPNGTIGHRWENKQQWNLHLKDMDNELGDIDPLLTFIDDSDDVIEVTFPNFSKEKKETFSRGVPVKKIAIDGQTQYVTTVFDLFMANSGVNRNLPGDYPTSTEDDQPFTPAWQEKLTGVPAEDVAQIAREFAQNAIDSKGRSMIIMGSGINHWYHADMIYRTILNLVLLTGCQGVNGGGWAHYVGQEKVRPLEGWQTVAMARDWGITPRLHAGTPFFYFATEQWRYEDQDVGQLTSPLTKKPRYQHFGDYNSLATRLGWLPSYPQFNKNPLHLGDNKTTEEATESIVEQIKSKDLNFAIDRPGDPENFPKILFVWRANLIGSSAKGHEYFLKHLLGTHEGTLSEQTEEEERRTNEIQWIEDIPEGKLDLLINYDFRMSGTGLYADIVLPSATWYEKYDLSSTDMHPFVHPFNPAITPPWQSKTDWDAFKSLAKRFSEMAKKYFPKPVKDVVTSPLLHDSRDEISQSYGTVPDWKYGKHQLKPGHNFPRIQVIERDYTKVYDKFVTLGNNIREQIGAKGISWKAEEEHDYLKKLLGVNRRLEHYPDLPSLQTDRDVAECILTLSSTTNGAVALKAWQAQEENTGQSLTDLISGRSEEKITFNEITEQPRKVLTTPVYSGSETGERKYSPFTTNVERLIPFRTLTGRQHMYLDHDLMLEFGEELPTFKPPLQKLTFYSGDRKPEIDHEITLRYLTPHYKWSYHSTYWDTLPMLTLFRGGPHVWLNIDDAKAIDIDDNDWLEMYNRNGVVVARAVVSHRIPKGIVYMYHVQDRYINVPGSKITGQRGGTFNSPTRIHVKPTHMIGGYAQLSYGFNYYGPTGNQRDEQVNIRKMKKEEVDWLED
ncbi:MAG TPA: nitrate reductase subunit alpha [Bacillota bacterium]|nr:nitrate reductase subunit alpha [Bacillota bacterium]